MALGVSHPHLPDRARLSRYVDRIYTTGSLTNSGPLMMELEQRLAAHLGVPRLLLVANGTLALQVAYRVLGVTGSAVTTPFSFVATVSSLAWEGIDPVFVDISPHTLNLDPGGLDASTTHGATAVVPVHVYGNPCDVDGIERAAASSGMKVIYDAAHAFGVEHRGRGIGTFGDASIFSFHATKVFHTVEGGGIAFVDEAADAEARRMINFGIRNAEEITGVGINAKMNEFEAAVGLAVLDEIDQVIDARRAVVSVYRERLDGMVDTPVWAADSTENYAYFPVILDSEEETLAVIGALEAAEIHPRRYFKPSLDTLGYVSSHPMKHSRDIASRVLCLPLHTAMTPDDARRVADIVEQTITR